jgi:hypothetical protein
MKKMGNTLVLMWRDRAATVEVRLTGGASSDSGTCLLANSVCRREAFQVAAALCYCEHAGIKVSGLGSRIGLFPGSHVGG